MPSPSYAPCPHVRCYLSIIKFFFFIRFNNFFFALDLCFASFEETRLTNVQRTSTGWGELAMYAMHLSIIVFIVRLLCFVLFGLFIFVAIGWSDERP